mmetsp:Transcript_24085/g.78447  ORF Transcript_24085/g.78447 Transcript_24085/m.78447 type:complete len:336 (-) Transcript_24085:238-1245(-)
MEMLKQEPTLMPRAAATKARAAIQRASQEQAFFQHDDPAAAALARTKSGGSGSGSTGRQVPTPRASREPAHSNKRKFGSIASAGASVGAGAGQSHALSAGGAAAAAADGRLPGGTVQWGIPATNSAGGIKRMEAGILHRIPSWEEGIKQLSRTISTGSLSDMAGVSGSAPSMPTIGEGSQAVFDSVGSTMPHSFVGGGGAGHLQMTRVPSFPGSLFGSSMPLLMDVDGDPSELARMMDNGAMQDGPIGLKLRKTPSMINLVAQGLDRTGSCAGARAGPIASSPRHPPLPSPASLENLNRATLSGVPMQRPMRPMQFQPQPQPPSPPPPPLHRWKS